MRRIYALLYAIAVSALTASAAAQDANWTTAEIQEAYEQGDHITAFKGFRSRAEQGDVRAQYMIGAMYYNRGQASGPGRRNPVEAAWWFRLAAEQGYTPAQYWLSSLYSSRDGVPHDLIQAYKWAALVASAPSSEDSPQLRRMRSSAAGFRDSVESHLPAEQLAEAQRLVQEWKPREQNLETLGTTP